MVSLRADVFVCFVFFFSSRRRHTRSLCDWSSDVCSSDLAPPRRARRRPAGSTGEGGPHARAPPEGHGLGRASRSEERRVGKECRSRWTQDHEKKKKKETHKIVHVKNGE